MPNRLALEAQEGGAVVRRRTALLALVLLALVAGRALALTIQVDGDPSDWGIAPAAWGQSDWVPLAGVQGTWPPAENDHKPGSDGGRVVPGWGGQTFDAEALYFTFDDAYAYFALVTGMPPTGTQGEWPGDLALAFGDDSAWKYAIETIGDHGLVPGGLYGNVAWDDGHWPVSDPTMVTSGELLWAPGSTGLCYSFIQNQHYLVETAVPLAALPLAPTEPTWFRAHWTQTCGNDAVDMAGGLPAAPHHPEPTTLVLLGGALVRLVRRRRRR